jgi:hypothetical protein
MRLPLRRQPPLRLAPGRRAAWGRTGPLEAGSRSRNRRSVRQPGSK